MPFSTPEERWRAANEAEEHRKKPEATTSRAEKGALSGVNTAGMGSAAQARHEAAAEALRLHYGAGTVTPPEGMTPEQATKWRAAFMQHQQEINTRGRRPTEAPSGLIGGHFPERYGLKGDVVLDPERIKGASVTGAELVAGTASPVASAAIDARYLNKAIEERDLPMLIASGIGLAAVVGPPGGSILKAAKESIAPKVTETLKAAKEGDRAAIRAGEQMLDEAAEARRLWQEIGTESPYFQRWFRLSVVTDSSGKPLIMLHGTPAGGFTAFDPNFINPDGLFGPGFYFTDSGRIARSYSRKRVGNAAHVQAKAKLRTAVNYDPRMKAATSEYDNKYQLLADPAEITTGKRARYQVSHADTPIYYETETTTGALRDLYSHRHFRKQPGDPRPGAPTPVSGKYAGQRGKLRSVSSEWVDPDLPHHYYSWDPDLAQASEDIDLVLPAFFKHIRGAKFFNEPEALREGGARLEQHVRHHQLNKARLQGGWTNEDVLTKKFDEYSPEVLEDLHSRGYELVANPRDWNPRDRIGLAYQDLYTMPVMVVPVGTDKKQVTQAWSRVWELNDEALDAQDRLTNLKRAITAEHQAALPPQPKKQVYETHLSIENPIDMDAPADMDHWMDGWQKMGMDEMDINEMIKYGPSTNEDFYKETVRALKNLGDSQSAAKIQVQEQLIEMGHDGITHRGGGRRGRERHRVYIAFEPNQIKSLENGGMFDLKNADLEASLAGALDMSSRYG